jgi:hypothetical protein
MAGGAVDSGSAGVVVGAPNVGAGKEEKVGGMVEGVGSGAGSGQFGEKPAGEGKVVVYMEAGCG